MELKTDSGGPLPAQQLKYAALPLAVTAAVTPVSIKI